MRRRLRVLATCHRALAWCVRRSPAKESVSTTNCLTCPEHYIVKRGPACSHHCAVTGGEVPHEDLADRVSRYRDGRVYRAVLAPRCPLNLRKGEGARMALASTVKIAMKRGRERRLAT